MGKLENPIKAKILNYLKTNLEWGFRCQSFEGNVRNKSGNHYYMKSGKKGIPDVIVPLLDGRTLFIEVKFPGKKLSKKQIEFRDYCLTHSIPWMLANSEYDVSDYLKAYFKKTIYAKSINYLR